MLMDAAKMRTSDITGSEKLPSVGNSGTPSTTLQLSQSRGNTVLVATHCKTRKSIFRVAMANLPILTSDLLVW